MLIFHFRIHTDINTTEAHKTVPHLCEELWQSHLSRAKQLKVKHEEHGRLPCDMLFDVTKTFEVNLSLLHKHIDIKYLSKFTSYKTTVECSNPKDDLQTPKCKSFGIIQKPPRLFLNA